MELPSQNLPFFFLHLLLCFNHKINSLFRKPEKTEKSLKKIKRHRNFIIQKQTSDFAVFLSRTSVLIGHVTNVCWF